MAQLSFALARNQVEQSLDARHLGKAGSLQYPDAGILGLL
jgi:hypothetical protein